ncbi:hypothetical protein [Peribacillus muralis]|nr:hypothetical protein [Peribacillus muralis]
MSLDVLFVRLSGLFVSFGGLFVSLDVLFVKRFEGIAEECMNIVRC